MVLLQLMGGILAFIAFVSLAFLLIKNKNINQNFTSWFLAGVIDFFIFFLIEKEEGNYYLSLANACGSFVIAFILLFRKKVKWNKSWDTTILILVLICLFVWKISSTQITIIVSILASSISFIPQIKETSEEPTKTPWLIYVVFLFADSCSCFSSKDYSVKESLYGFTEVLLTLIILGIIFYARKTKNSMAE